MKKETSTRWEYNMKEHYEQNQAYLVSGKTFNEIAAGVNRIQRNAFNLQSPTSGRQDLRAGEILAYLNVTDPALSLPIYSAVTIADIAAFPTPPVYGSPTFSVRSFQVDDPDDLPLAIVTAPLIPMRPVRAVMTGIVPARVNITDRDHRYAVPVHDESGTLTSAASGIARILYQPGEVGQQWCLLILGSPSPVSSSSWVPARVKSGSAETGYTVDLYARGKDNGITTSDVTVFLPYAMYGAAIPAGSWIMVTQSQTIVIPDEEDGV